MRYRKTGFTMIELLTVIAIIAVLAGIIFPVFARVKENAYKNSDMANMGQINHALQLYKADQDAFPPAILGYATLYTSDSSVVPADRLVTYIYPNRLSNINDFHPALLSKPANAITKAVWPQQDPAPVGSAPYKNLASGCTDEDDTSTHNYGNRQRYGSGQLVKRPITYAEYQGLQTLGFNPDIDMVGVGTSGITANAYFYNISGYDVADVKVAGAVQTELHYTRFWTTWGLGNSSATDPGGNNGRCDDPRQLGYAAPPSDTVVTWNSQYREYDVAGNATNSKKDVVLFLNGGVKPASSAGIAAQSWRYGP